MKSIEIVMITAKDQTAAKAFYEKLGFHVVLEAPNPEGGMWIQMGLPQGNTTISLANFPAIICETEDIEKEVEALRLRGMEAGKIDDTPWGRFAWVKDPDGNGICLHQKIMS